MAFLGIGLGMILAISSQPYWNRYVHTTWLCWYSQWSALFPHFSDQIFYLDCLNGNLRNMKDILPQKLGLSWARSEPFSFPSVTILFTNLISSVHWRTIIPGLFWLAFTTYPHVHWVVPIIASVPFGSGIYFVFTSTFTYLVTAYRPIAASAMASNSAVRSTFAAVFPLFARAMYARLGTVGATALLAGLTTVMAPLPWVYLLFIAIEALQYETCLICSHRFIFYRIGSRLRQKSRFATAWGSHIPRNHLSVLQTVRPQIREKSSRYAPFVA